ncbi:MAG: hypothetical protein RSD71_12220 [Flavobacterium sp.]
MSLTSHSQTESSHSNGKLNKKASDFSEAFVLVAGSSQLSNLFFEDYYSILALAS